jgi:hypothetical protein
MSTPDREMRTIRFRFRIAVGRQGRHGLLKINDGRASAAYIPRLAGTILLTEIYSRGRKVSWKIRTGIS